MSCSIDLELIPQSMKKKISHELKVVSKPTPYGGGETIICFETQTVQQEDEEETVYVLIPFAYFYHYFTPICKQSHPNNWIQYPKTKPFKFVGKLNKMQEEIKNETYEIINRSRSIIVSLFTGGGKCLHPDTKVLLWNGDITMAKDIKIGDYLIGDDNAKRKVLSTCKGKETMYKIKQKKGDDYIVNESHILSLKFSIHKNHSWTQLGAYRLTWFDFSNIKMMTKSFSISAYGTKENAFIEMEKFKSEIPDNDILDITVKEFLLLSKSIRWFFKGFKKGVEFPKQTVFMDPYILGAWLGDGDSSGRGFTNIDSECLDYFKNYIKDELECKMKSTPSDLIHYDITRDEGKRNNFKDLLDFYSLRYNKHIPKDYLLNDRETRLELLAGLLDTDGYYIINQKGYEITQKNKILSDNILYLIRSLGYAASQVETKKSCMYKGEKREGTYHRISFSGDNIEEIPCKIKRKKASKRLINKDALVTGIEIEKLEEGNYCGFEIDGNKRFLLGDFTVTHNTAYTNFLVSKLQYKTLVVCHRINIIEQWGYAAQKFCPDATFQVLTSSNKKNPDADIYIINVSSICKRDINDFKDIGILVVDEADKTVCTDGGSKSLFLIRPKYCIALTATPHRTDRKSEILELHFGPEIIQRKLFRPFNAYFINTGYKIKAQMTKMGRLDWNHVLETQCQNDERNDLITDILRYFKNRKFLVLCKRKDQTDLLMQKLLAYDEDVDKYTGTQKICNYDCRILLTTYSKSGVGFDHPSLDALIIASDVEEGIEQYLGRVFRREDSQPMIFDLVDKLHTLFKHFVTRRLLYESKGADVKLLNECFPEFFDWRTEN